MYKVFYRHEDGSLESATHHPLQITDYKKDVKRVPDVGRIFLFLYVEDAKDFRNAFGWPRDRMEIWEVDAGNPTSQHYMCATYARLDQMCDWWEAPQGELTRSTPQGTFSAEWIIPRRRIC